MDRQVRKVVSIVLVIILVTVAFIFWSYFIENESFVISSIDEVNLKNIAMDNGRLNTTVVFSVYLVNRGKLEQVSIPCNEPVSYLDLYQSTKPLEYYQNSDSTNTSLYYTPSAFEQRCEGEPRDVWIAEGEIAEITATVSFGFVSGNYSFIWIHSYAKEYGMVTLEVFLYNETILTSFRSIS